MAQFEPAFKITMSSEGGYANNPADHGGETYKGIARNYWKTWAGWPIVDRIAATKPPKLNTALAADAHLQTLVLSFYKTNFWDTESLDSINDQQVANQLFDTAVNMGTAAASKFLQQAVNTIKPNALTVDGQIGSHTIAEANSCTGAALYNAVCHLRKAKYDAIIAHNPTQQQFAKSWFSRMPAYKV
jgi:lysozyme family protein